MPVRFISRGLAAATLVAALLLAGCGGDDDPQQPPPSNGVTLVAGTPAGTPPSLTPTAVSDAAKTAVAVGGAVPMVPYEHASGLFSVSLPEGWARSDEAKGVAAFLPSLDPQYAASAQVGVGCYEGGTVDELILVDQELYRRVQMGEMTLERERPTTVGDGIPAREIPWTGALGEVAHEHINIYFETEACTWRMVLTTFPNVRFEDMLPVLDEMKRTFRPTAGTAGGGG